mmetsp:Transcript_16884/g.25431  ORF Transcript_16884/g.25431 Transcript_16884/m.25431 type:complete len:751 (+) Transcript_16884:72-2324(+)
MGVSSSIPYDMNDEIQLTSLPYWQLFHGRKKDDDTIKKDQVSIFKYTKTPANVSYKTLAQRGIQRLKTIKHPYVLSYIESTELEDSIAVVTEYGMPVDAWVRQHSGTSISEAEKESLLLEVLWGLKCVIEGCNFLHASCRITHGMVSPQSCFVTKNGDWKLGFLDVACDVSEEREHFKLHESMLENEYRCPERMDGSWVNVYSKEVSAPSSSTGSSFSAGPTIDIYSIGRLIEYVFSALPLLERPQALTGPLKRMLSAEPKRRPACPTLLRIGCFHSEQLNMMTAITELQLKPPGECVELFKELRNKIDVISRAACTFKILPSLGQSLSHAAGEFQNRDARETCRQTVQSSLDLLAGCAGANKVEEAPFLNTCLVPLQQLWMLSDRTIRTALLRSLKSLVHLLPRESVNKRIFDPLMGGFADSNAKLREETLKSLVHIVDKLDEQQLQDKLVRCISGLQNDPENSIRTNATIFISRIMPKLKESVRNRVLAQAYTKAMKDPFSHCRIAGLKATDASLQLCDPPALMTRLMPQICLLLADKSPDVRELALSVLEASSKVVKKHHTERRASAPSAAPDNTPGKPTSSIPTPPSSSSGSNFGTSDWTTWAVDGLSKSIQQVTTDSPSRKVQSAPEQFCQGQVSGADSSGSLKEMDPAVDINSSSLAVANEKEVVAGGWSDDDDMDLDNILDNPSREDNIPNMLESSVSSPPSFSDRNKKSTASVKKDSSNKKAKPVVKKLAVSSDGGDNWDDF